MPSQSDVAKKARVSFMTVSRVVNNQGNVKPETRQKVLAAIKELNYYPNAAARALNQNRSFGVGVFVSQNEFLFAAPYFLSLIVELERCFRKKGYHLVFDTLEQDSKTDYSLLYYQRQVDGVVVIAPGREKSQLKRLVSQGIPSVVLYGNSGRDDIPYIDVDSTGGIRLLMGELKRLNHRRVAFIRGQSDLPMAEERYNGYRIALGEFGMDEDEALVYKGDWTAKSGIAAFRSFFALEEPPTAVLCSNDLMALGFMQAAAKNGKQIPADVSLGGFNNAGFTPYLTPPLTTLGQPIDTVAHTAAEVLVPLMEAGKPGDPSGRLFPGKTPAPARILTPKPFWRESFGPPPDREFFL